LKLETFSFRFASINFTPDPIPQSTQAAAEGISTFADVNAARVTGAIGPALLPPFTFDPALAAADVEAGKPEASLTDVCMAYEKALRGDDWDFMEDSDDEGDVTWTRLTRMRMR
jgi:hypothetical protein